MWRMALCSFLKALMSMEVWGARAHSQEHGCCYCIAWVQIPVLRALWRKQPNQDLNKNHTRWAWDILGQESTKLLKTTWGLSKDIWATRWGSQLPKWDSWLPKWENLNTEKNEWNRLNIQICKSPALNITKKITSLASFKDHGGTNSAFWRLVNKRMKYLLCPYGSIVASEWKRNDWIRKITILQSLMKNRALINDS